MLSWPLATPTSPLLQKELEHLTRATKHELDALPEILSDLAMIQKRKKLNDNLQSFEQGRLYYNGQRPISLSC